MSRVTSAGRSDAVDRSRRSCRDWLWRRGACRLEVAGITQHDAHAVRVPVLAGGETAWTSLDTLIRNALIAQRATEVLLETIEHLFDRPFDVDLIQQVQAAAQIESRFMGRRPTARSARAACAVPW